MWSVKFEWIIATSHYINYCENKILLFIQIAIVQRFIAINRGSYVTMPSIYTRARRFLFSSFIILKYLDETDNFVTANLWLNYSIFIFQNKEIV